MPNYPGSRDDRRGRSQDEDRRGGSRDPQGRDFSGGFQQGAEYGGYGQQQFGDDERTMRQGGYPNSRQGPGGQRGAPQHREDWHDAQDWHREAADQSQDFRPVQRGGSYGGYGGLTDQGRDFGHHPDGRHHDNEFDPEYLQWRNEQLRSLDDDYRSWRGERYRKFSEEFSSWRKNRAGEAAAGNQTDASKQQPGKTGSSSSKD